MAETPPSPFGMDPSRLAMMSLMYPGMFGGGMGQGGMGFNPMMLMDPRIQMQASMGQNLLQQGTSTAPALTPLAGLARVGSAIMGGNMMQNVYDKMQQQQGTGSQQQQNLQKGHLAFSTMLGEPGTAWRDWFDSQPDYVKSMVEINPPPALSTYLEKVKMGQGEALVPPTGAPPTMSPVGANDAQRALQTFRALKNPTAEDRIALGKSLLETGYTPRFNPDGTVTADFIPGTKADPNYAATMQAATSSADAWARLTPELRKLYATPQMINGVLTTPAHLLGIPDDVIKATNPQTGAYTPPAGGGGAGGSQGATGPQGPAGATGTAAGGGSATGAAAPPAATANAPASTATAPASTTPTPPTQAPPPTSTEKNVAPMAAYTATGGGVTPDPRIDAGIHAGEQTLPGQVGKAGEVTSYQITKGAAQAVGMAPPKTEAEGSAVAQAYMAQNLRRFGNLPDAFAAYNWGPNAVANWINRGRDPSKMPASVQAYVQRAMGAYNNAAGGAAAGAAPAPAPTPTPQPQPQQDIPQQVLPPEQTALLPATAGGPGWAAPMPMLRPGGAAQAQQTPTPAPTPTPTPTPTPSPAPTQTPTQTPTVTAPTQTPTQTPTQQPPPGLSRNFDPTKPLEGAGPDYGPNNPYHGTGQVTQTAAGALVGPDPTVKPLVDEAQKTYDTYTAKYQAAQSAFQHLDVMQRDIDELNANPNAPSTGRTFELRQEVAGIWNDIVHKLDQNGIAGLKPFDQAALASGESFQKETNNMAQQVGGAIHATDNTIEGAYHGTPNASLSDKGNRFVLQVLKQTYNRDRDLHLFQNAWMTDPNNPGHVLVGSEEAFNKAHPITDYMKMAYYNVIPPAAVDHFLQAVDANGGKIPAQERSYYDSLFGKGMADFTVWQHQQGVAPGQQ